MPFSPAPSNVGRTVAKRTEKWPYRKILCRQLVKYFRIIYLLPLAEPDDHQIFLRQDKEILTVQTLCVIAGTELAPGRIVPLFPSDRIEHPFVFRDTQFIEPLRHLVPVPEEFGGTLAVHDMPGSIVPAIGIEIIQIVPADALSTHAESMICCPFQLPMFR